MANLKLNDPPAVTLRGELSATVDINTPEVPVATFVSHTFLTGPQPEPVPENTTAPEVAWYFPKNVATEKPLRLETGCREYPLPDGSPTRFAIVSVSEMTSLESSPK